VPRERCRLNDDDVKMKVVIFKADFVSTRMRCGKPSTGSYDSFLAASLRDVLKKTKKEF
jgi:hypothetical protein